MKYRFNKYGNTSTRCAADHYHDSCLEAGYCDSLNMLKRAGEIRDYKSQVSYDLVVDGHKICSHIVDFVVTNKEGKEEIHETKGFATAEWRLKYNLFRACFPNIPYIVITKERSNAQRSQDNRPKKYRRW
jgi:hypothetical protein